jgi:hypothetical protein
MLESKIFSVAALADASNCIAATGIPVPNEVYL